MTALISKEALCEAVRSTIAGLFVSAQGPASLKESIPDYPAVQVYPDEWDTDNRTGNDRSTFGAGVRQREVTLFADVFVKPRAVLSEDIIKQVRLSDQIDELLDQQRETLFNESRIKSMKWRGQRATFEENNTSFVGLRYTINLWVF